MRDKDKHESKNRYRIARMKKLFYTTSFLKFSHDIIVSSVYINKTMIINPNHRKKLNIVWGIFAILIAISMVLLYLPSLYR